MRERESADRCSVQRRPQSRVTTLTASPRWFRKNQYRTAKADPNRCIRNRRNIPIDTALFEVTRLEKMSALGGLSDWHWIRLAAYTKATRGRKDIKTCHAVGVLITIVHAISLTEVLEPGVVAEWNP